MLKFTVSIGNTIQYDVLATSSSAALLAAFEKYPEEFAVSVVEAKLPDPCPLTGRRVVTVGQWLDRPEWLRDAAAYYYEHGAEGPPWALIRFFDPHSIGNRVDLALGFQRNLTVTRDQQIYISANSHQLLPENCPHRRAGEVIK